MKGEDVKKILKKGGYTLNEIAEAMNETPQNLQSMLRASDIKTGVLERIAHAINKNLYFFFKDIRQKNVNGDNINGNNVVIHKTASIEKTAFDKRQLLMPLYQLSLFPDAIELKNMDYLRKTFYLAVKKMLIDFGGELTKEQIFTISENLQCNTNDLKVLISKIDEKKKDEKNKYFAKLGFRAVWEILSLNIDRIDPEYIYGINRMFQPFFVAFPYKNLLTAWLGITPDNFD